jgi:hypothetical protein
MSSLTSLLIGYPGEPAWQRLVDVFRPAWSGRGDHEALLVAVDDDESIAIVLDASFGNRSLAWFEQPVKALEGHTPKQILNDYAGGKIILKSLLMRLP